MYIYNVIRVIIVNTATFAFILHYLCVSLKEGYMSWLIKECMKLCVSECVCACVCLLIPATCLLWKKMVSFGLLLGHVFCMYLFLLWNSVAVCFFAVWVVYGVCKVVSGFYKILVYLFYLTEAINRINTLMRYGWVELRRWWNIWIITRKYIGGDILSTTTVTITTHIQTLVALI